MATIIDKLRAEIKAAEAKIANIQTECNHPKSARTSKEQHHSSGSAGGGMERWYSATHHCGLCDKTWESTRNAD